MWYTPHNSPGFGFGSVVLCCSYIAPEVATSQKYERGYGTMADIWSLGCMFFPPMLPSYSPTRLSSYTICGPRSCRQPLIAPRHSHTIWCCFGGAISPAGTVVEMLTGRLPYADMGPEQAYYLIGLKCAPV